jgi:hypothetical protein
MSDADRLSREAARIAGRLAALLVDAPDPLGADSPGVAFLRAFAATVHFTAENAEDNSVARRLNHRGHREQQEQSSVFSVSSVVQNEEPSASSASSAVQFDEPSASSAVQTPSPSSIDRLAVTLGLTQTDIDLLVLAGMAEEHEGFASVFRALHPRNEPRPTVGLAAQLLCDSAAARHALRERLLAGPLVGSGALALGGDDAPLFERSLVPADALWPALAGVDVWPEGASPVTTCAESAGLDAWLATPSARRAMAAIRARAAVTVLVVAGREDDALHRAAALARHAGARSVAFVLPETTTDAGRAVAARAIRLAALHAALRGRAPIVRATGDGAVDVPPVDGPLVIAAREDAPPPNGDRPLLAVRAERLGAAARACVWRAALPDLAADAVGLAARVSLEPHAAEAVAADARAAAAIDGRAPNADDVMAGVRARAGLSVAAGVRLVRPAASWEQLVLPADRHRLLREAIDRVLHQARVLDEWGFLRDRPGARGVRVLFAGPPGTGKTLAAEVMAHTLGVDLLVVDLSRVVSKWIGETEKNLAEAFDAAERSQAVLLFDEADALFGRRTAVSDAHDRYANLETAYLLARLERFEGLTILSTNLRDNIDDAFTRRLEFVVDFDAPAAAEREAIWRSHLPAAAPLAADVRLAELATLYPLVGGHIRNASVAAGFLAAAAGTPITRAALVRAVRREYEKAGRAFPGAPAGVNGA